MTPIAIVALILLAFAFALALVISADRWTPRTWSLHVPPLDPAASTMRGLAVDREGRPRPWQ